MKIYHPPSIPPIKGGNVPSSLVGEGQGEGYFRAKYNNRKQQGSPGRGDLFVERNARTE